MLRHRSHSDVFPICMCRFINAVIWSMVSISSQLVFCSDRTFKVHDGMIADHVRFFSFFLAMMFSAARCAKSPEGNIWRPFSDDRSKLRTTSSIRGAVQVVATGLRNALNEFDLGMHH